MIRHLIVLVLVTLALMSPAAAAGRHNDGCSRAGDAAGINCQLRAHVQRKCPPGAVMITQHGYRKGDRYCKWDPTGACMITAAKTSKGTRLSVTNPNTGASTTLIVGDWGPGTIAKLDLSPYAARELGYGRGSGCAYVGGNYEAKAR